MPAFDDYAMEGRYRYFRGTPYPFGHGLSYTRFEYGGLRLDADAIRADGHLRVQVDVAAGAAPVTRWCSCMYDASAAHGRRRAGAARLPACPPGSGRTPHGGIHPGAALRHYDDARAAYVVRPGAYEVRVGASSADVRAHGFTVVPTHD